VQPSTTSRTVSQVAPLQSVTLTCAFVVGEYLNQVDGLVEKQVSPAIMFGAAPTVEPAISPEVRIGPVPQDVPEQQSAGQVVHVSPGSQIPLGHTCALQYATSTNSNKATEKLMFQLVYRFLLV
jgi:hypothetical protein